MFGNSTKIHLKIPDAHCVDRPLIGAAIVEVSAPTDIKKIQINFNGEAEIEYEYNKVVENSEGQKTTVKAEYKKEKKFEKMKVSIAGPQTLQPGVHTIPFELNLPKTLPAAFKYKLKDKVEAEIKYRLHAKILKGALKSDTKSEKYKLKILPATPAPKPAEKSDKNKFMFGKGTSTVSIKLDDTNFKLGDKIAIQVTCANESKKNNKAIKAKLEQRIRLKSGEHEIPDYNHSKTVVEVKAEGVGAKHDTVTRELVIDTSKLPPTVDHKFIDIEYKLKVSADYAWARDPEAKLDVQLVPMAGQPKAKNYTTGSQPQLAAANPMKADGSQPQLIAVQQQQPITA